MLEFRNLLLSPAVRSNAGMANGQGDVDLRFAQVSAPQLTLWLGLVAWPEIHSFNQHRHRQKTHPQDDSSKQASRKPQQYQEWPVRSLHIKTDSQSVSRGVIWSLTAKGVGLSVTVQKGVRHRLTPNNIITTPRQARVAVPGACRSIVRHRSSVPLARR